MILSLIGFDVRNHAVERNEENAGAVFPPSFRAVFDADLPLAGGRSLLIGDQPTISSVHFWFSQSDLVW